MGLIFNAKRLVRKRTIQSNTTPYQYDLNSIFIKLALDFSSRPFPFWNNF
jgi:hypothetical protein